MITTSTPEIKLNGKAKIEKVEHQLPDFESPSSKSIEAILNFSRNLEVKESTLVKNVEYIKS